MEPRRFPQLEQIASLLGGSVTTSPVAVSLDCPDGSGEAYYGRPEAFLDPRVRQAQSAFRLTDADAVERGAERLRRDLDVGDWTAATATSAECPSGSAPCDCSSPSPNTEE
jgi:hypothetical protein